MRLADAQPRLCEERTVQKSVRTCLESLHAHQKRLRYARLGCHSCDKWGIRIPRLTRHVRRSESSEMHTDTLMHDGRLSEWMGRSSVHMKVQATVRGWPTVRIQLASSKAAVPGGSGSFVAP